MRDWPRPAYVELFNTLLLECRGMDPLSRFKKFAGKEIIVAESGSHAYVPTAEQHDDLAQIVAEDTHPDEEVEDGYSVVAILGAFEEGELVQPEGFIAVNAADDKAYVCDEGSITEYEVPASKLTIELDED